MAGRAASTRSVIRPTRSSSSTTARRTERSPPSGAAGRAGAPPGGEPRLCKRRERRRRLGPRRRRRVAERRRRGRPLVARQLQAECSASRRRRGRRPEDPAGAPLRRGRARRRGALGRRETARRSVAGSPRRRLDGEDVLGELVGPGIHQLEHGPGGRTLALDSRAPALLRADLRGAGTGGSRDRRPRRRRPQAAPPRNAAVPPSTTSSVVLDGEPVPIRRVVDLVNSAGSYLRKDGYAGDCGADLPDDDRWNLSQGVLRCQRRRTRDDRLGAGTRRALRAQLLRLLRGHRLVLASTPAGLSHHVRPVVAPSATSAARRAGGSSPAAPGSSPSATGFSPWRAARPLRPRGPRGKKEVVRRRRRRRRGQPCACASGGAGAAGAPAPHAGWSACRDVYDRWAGVDVP